MRIELEYEPLELPLAVPFTIARGTRAVAENVLVRLTWEAPDGRRMVGLGEAAPNAYYGENVATVRAALDAYTPLLGDDPLALEAILARLPRALGRNAAARAAIDMALHDLAGQLTGLPLWRWWGLERDAGPLTSFTIGMAEPAVVAQRAKSAAAAGFPLLKIKLGSGDSGSGPGHSGRRAGSDERAAHGGRQRRLVAERGRAARPRPRCGRRRATGAAGGGKRSRGDGPRVRPHRPCR